MLQKDIKIVPIRNLSHEDAKKEIIEYLEKAGKRKVYVSEIVEKLRLDIELTSDILHNWRDQMCNNLCGYGINPRRISYKCPIIKCIYSNYMVK